jgi:ATP-dependent Clp protease ATP-binding subunit ClpA
MSVPYDDFCKEVLEKAKARSLSLENGFVGTEHILWAILKSEGLLKAFLVEREVTIDEICSLLETEMSNYTGLTREPGPQTPRLRRMLLQAQQMALQTMASVVDERILMEALLSGGPGIALRALETISTLEEIKNHLQAGSKADLREKTSWLLPENLPSLSNPIPIQIYPQPMKYFSPILGSNKEGKMLLPPMSEPITAEKNSLCGRDLSGLAKARLLSPIFGREKELEELCLTLRRATVNNPVLLGEQGVGKTSLVEGLAILIASGNLPDPLRTTRLIEVSRGKLFQFLNATKDGEERLREFVKNAPFPGTIFFLDDILELLEEERLPWSVVGAINLLKDSIDEGKIRVIIAATPRIYEKRIAADPILSKNCQKIEVRDLKRDSTIEALKSLVKRFEQHHRVSISPELTELAVELSEEYIKDRFLPGKAIDILDEACAIAGMRHATGKTQRGAKLSESDILQAIAKKSGLPLEKISRKTEKFKTMEEEIKKKIIGQNEAVNVVCDRVKLFMTGLHEENRPLGVLFFSGPTGVGKTELARVVSSYLFGSDSHFYRYDMSEYSQPHEVSRLVGAPPGYVGFEEEGQLTGKIRRDPYCVLLLDEVEKAHPRIFDVFLQVFDAGRLTDGRGNTVDFRNTLIIMTSNIGPELWDEERSLGFRQIESQSTGRAAGLKERMITLLKEKFSAEFVNRIDEVVVFRFLDKDDIKTVTRLIVKEWSEKSMKLGVNLEVSDALLEHLCETGYSRQFGVRNMKRIVENTLIIPLSRNVLEGTFSSGDLVLGTYREGHVVLEKTKVDDKKGQ